MRGEPFSICHLSFIFYFGKQPVDVGSSDVKARGWSNKTRNEKRQVENGKEA